MKKYLFCHFQNHHGFLRVTYAKVSEFFGLNKPNTKLMFAVLSKSIKISNYKPDERFAGLSLVCHVLRGEQETR